VRQDRRQTGVAHPGEGVGDGLHRDQPRELDQDVLGATQGDPPHALGLPRERAIEHDLRAPVQSGQLRGRRPERVEGIVVPGRRPVGGLGGP
jgi:hypothetical protein